MSEHEKKLTIWGIPVVEDPTMDKDTVELRQRGIVVGSFTGAGFEPSEKVVCAWGLEDDPKAYAEVVTVGTRWNYKIVVRGNHEGLVRLLHKWVTGLVEDTLSLASARFQNEPASNDTEKGGEPPKGILHSDS